MIHHQCLFYQCSARIEKLLLLCPVCDWHIIWWQWGLISRSWFAMICWPINKSSIGLVICKVVRTINIMFRSLISWPMGQKMEVTMLEWRIGWFLLKDFFWRLYFCMVKYLSFHNSCFAFKQDTLKCKWQGHTVTHPLFFSNGCWLLLP